MTTINSIHSSPKLNGPQWKNGLCYFIRPNTTQETFLKAQSPDECSLEVNVKSIVLRKGTRQQRTPADGALPRGQREEAE
jgi:hypothetical protein